MCHDVIVRRQFAIFVIIITMFFWFLPHIPVMLALPNNSLVFYDYTSGKETQEMKFEASKIFELIDNELVFYEWKGREFQN